MNETLTIKEARDLMRPLIKKGTPCLCCGGHTQIYTRSLTSSMIHGLILLYRKTLGKIEQGDPDPYIHLENFFKEMNVPASIRGDIPKSRFWGLLEPRGVKKDDSNPNDGFYAITQKGMSFIEGKVLIQKSVKLYNNQFYGFEGPEIDVWGAIKNKFNYNEMIGGKI